MDRVEMDSREEIGERGLEAVFLTRNRWGVYDFRVYGCCRFFVQLV